MVSYTWSSVRILAILFTNSPAPPSRVWEASALSLAFFGLFQTRESSVRCGVCLGASSSGFEGSLLAALDAIFLVLGRSSGKKAAL